MEVIDEDHFFIEFEAINGKPIQIKGENIFKVSWKAVALMN